MSDGWHIYHCPPSGHPRLLKTVNTPAQARKNEFYYPSVTGVLGLLPNPFMAKWRGRKMVELSKENPGKEAEELEQLAWGTRTCPETGEEISSSDFGTRAHAAIEDWFERKGQWDGMSPYELVVNSTLDYLTKHFDFQCAEKVLCCHDLKIAGTVDYIGTDKDGKWMLADFKFRDVKEGTKATPYDKDRAQLAIEGEMWKNDLGLDYDPDIYSIIVDVNTGTPHVTKHSEKMRRKGLQLARVAAYVYWNLPGYGYVENEQLGIAMNEMKYIPPATKRMIKESITWRRWRHPVTYKWTYGPYSIIYHEDGYWNLRKSKKLLFSHEELQVVQKWAAEHIQSNTN